VYCCAPSEFEFIPVVVVPDIVPVVFPDIVPGVLGIVPEIVPVLCETFFPKLVDTDGVAFLVVVVIGNT